MAFHPNNVVVRSSLARAVGGWPALPVNEDILWCSALNERAPGLALPYTTLRYRRWDQQTVARPSFLAEKARAFTFIESVVNARRTRAGLVPISAPAPAAGSLYTGRPHPGP